MIGIKIKNKIASLIDPTDIFICDNNNYLIQFEFDEEWDSYPLKTARFIWANQYYDVLFTGNTVAAPAIEKNIPVSVGVYAGNLLVSRPVIINSVKSILTGATTAHSSLSSDVYNQIINLFNTLSVGKLDKSFGVSHSGDFLVVGDDGNVTTLTIETWEGGDY